MIVFINCIYKTNIPALTNICLPTRSTLMFEKVQSFIFNLNLIMYITIASYPCDETIFINLLLVISICYFSLPYFFANLLIYNNFIG